MRDIKFKYVFRNEKNGKVKIEVYSLDDIEYSVDDDVNYFAEEGYKLVERFQFTELKDLNGNDIYEGDKLSFKELVGNFEVKFGDGSFYINVGYISPIKLSQDYIVTCRLEVE